MTPLDPQVSRIQPLFAYLNKQRENDKFIKTLEIAGTFILISFFMFFAIKPTVLAISSLLGDIESKKILKKELRSKIDNVIKAQELFSQVQENYQIVNASLPDSPKYYQAAYQVQREGLESGITVDNLVFGLNDPTPEDIIISPDIKTYTVSVGVDGGFQSSSRLVSELLKNQRVVNIGSVGFYNVATSSATPTNNNLSTRFSVKFYYWPSNNAKK